MLNNYIILLLLFLLIILILGQFGGNIEGYGDSASTYSDAMNKTNTSSNTPNLMFTPNYTPNSNTTYRSDNYNVQYHENIDSSNNRQIDSYGSNSGNAWVIDPSGNKVALPLGNMDTNAIYYEPGSYPFGSASYVPSYEDSVYLSKTTGQSSVTPLTDSDLAKGGFCSNYKDFPDKLEEHCNKLDKNTCGATSCCVLFGGSKCVSGNEQGPKIQANYSNIFIRNRDYYYYQGKCYGNCNKMPSPTVTCSTPSPTTSIPTTPSLTSPIPTTPSPTTSSPTTSSPTTPSPTTSSPTTPSPTTPSLTTPPYNPFY